MEKNFLIGIIYVLLSVIMILLVNIIDPYKLFDAEDKILSYPGMIYIKY